MRALAILALLALAGCATGGLFGQNEPSPPPPEVPQVQDVPQGGTSSPAAGVPLSSPAARAAAGSDATVSTDGLLDCVTESCKINCSSKVKKQFQPKWCARFKPPAE